MARKYTQEEFLEKARSSSKALDCSGAIYISNNTKVAASCKKCGNRFEIVPRNIFRGVGCPFCNGGVRRTKEWFVRNSAKIHRNRYDYSKTDYINSKKKVCIICPEHGEFWQRPSHHLKGCGCPMCGNSSGERKICDILEGSGFALGSTYFTQKEFNGLQDKKPLRYDFYIPAENLLIEYNGLQHYKFPNLFHRKYRDFLIQKHHDWLKRKYARDHNIRLLTISCREEDSLKSIILSNISTNQADRP